MRISAGTDLLPFDFAQGRLAHVAEDLVAVTFGVLAAADKDPVVTTIGGFHNQLVEVGVGFVVIPND